LHHVAELRAGGAPAIRTTRRKFAAIVDGITLAEAPIGR
jgi:hypothetical protein